MITTYGDLETFSPTPITSGVHRYAEQAEIMIRALALDDGPILVRDLTPGGADWLLDGENLTPAPTGYVVAAEAELYTGDGEIYFHNSAFDRTILRHVMPHLCPPLHRWRDTMVQAMAHGLPGKLADLCDALKLPTDQAKDKAGKALIQLFCRPISFRFRKRETALESAAQYQAEKDAAEAAWPGRATRETHPDEWRKFLLYAGRDIEAMRAAHKLMPMWNYRGAELDLWHLDQRINDRGVAIDLELAECAVNAVDAAQIGLRERTQEMTNGEVESATKRDALLLHVLAEYGVDLPDMQKATIERRIADPDIPDGLKELLKVRLQASTTSTSKYKTLIKGVSSDNRLRGLLQFCGASRTGRWAGRLFQPQNLPSRGLMPADQVLMGIEALKGGYADLMFQNVMHLTSSAIRGCLFAPPGRKLVVADLSNIEGRVLAWLAGEQWKIKAFAAYDEGTGHDLYALAYAKSFGVTPESVMEDKKRGGGQRQVGKVQELALGYQGGVSAFLTFAATYNIDLEQMADQAFRAIPGNVMGQAKIMLEWHRKKFKRDPASGLGLTERAWLVCESFKIGWRSAHPATVQLWADMEQAMRSAIQNPGNTFTVGMLRVRKDGAWMRVVLPSGRAICYPGAALVPASKRKRGADLDAAGVKDIEVPDEGGKTVISYMGKDQYSRKWTRLTTYGGKAIENACQAVARDVMAANMPECEAAGYEIVLSVHDELLTETPDSDEWNAEGLAGIMATVPDWAPGMPLAAAGFEAYRYKKE